MWNKKQQQNKASTSINKAINVCMGFFCIKMRLDCFLYSCQLIFPAWEDSSNKLKYSLQQVLSASFFGWTNEINLKKQFGWTFTSKITKPFSSQCLLPLWYEVSRKIYLITECCELVTCMGFKPPSYGNVAAPLEKTNHELSWCQDPQDCWNHPILYRPNSISDMFKNMKLF